MLFLRWLDVVRKEFRALLTGSLLLALLGIYQAVSRRSVPWWLYAATAFVFLMSAFYGAWAKERRQYKAEKAKHDNPNLELQIVSILTQYIPTTNVTNACFAGIVINRGSPSIAFGWKVRYQSQSLGVPVGFVSLASDEYLWPEIGGRHLVLQREAMLPAKTFTVIERGHSRHGRVLFELPGNRLDEIYSGAAQMWIGCSDTTGRLCQALFKTGPSNKFQTLQLFPDETARDVPQKLRK